MPGHRFYNLDLASGHLSAEESHHAIDVLRLRVGDSAAVFDGKGSEARVRITTANSDGVSYEILSSIRTPLPTCRIRFGQAIIKPSSMELLVQKLTELGVSEIWPITSERSVIKPTREKRISSRWDSIALSACKQSGQNWIPTIHNAAPLDTFLSAPDPAPASARIIGSLQAEAQPLPVLLAEARITGPASSLDLLIGPEGDFTPAEIGRARAAGFRPASLGPLVLRSETASLFLAAVLHYELNLPR
ncbi:MAG: RsmE family RNA methyltransferase [Verrucomicrobia bacterium]|nr:RsmE family RNA methyltransferase [Verrucomicrobiota bacterium]